MHARSEQQRPRDIRIVGGVDEAQIRLWAGIRSALLIELVFGMFLLAGALLVAYWPHA